MVEQAAAPSAVSTPPAVIHTADCVPELARVYRAAGSNGDYSDWCAYCSASVFVPSPRGRLGTFTSAPRGED